MYALIFTILFSTFGGTAFGASTRVALVTEVTGTVKVTKAGGTKEMRAFTGMGLNEGDKVKVEKGSSLTLKVADAKDEVVLGENWSGTLSKLSSSTAFKAWAGSMYNKVEKVTGSSKNYRVETPTSVMGVRGTHFTVSIDPITGLPTMFVAAGKVEAQQLDSQQSTVVLPSQQIVLYPDTAPEAGVGYLDPGQLVGIADDEVIAKLLLSKQLIDEENEEILDTLPNDGDVEESTLDLTEEEALDRYARNVSNALYAILRTSVDSGMISEEEAEEIINQANQAIPDAGRQFDLDRPVPPIDRGAGIDPAAEQRRLQALQQAQQQSQRNSQRKDELRQEIEEEAAPIVERAEKKSQQQQQQNEQATQTRSEETVTKVLSNLSPAEQAALRELIEDIKQEEVQQEEKRDTTTPTTGTGNGSGSGSGTGGTPERRATTTTVTSTKSAIKRGETLTLRATVSVTGGSTVTSGTVTFRRGTTPIGTASLNGSGMAELAVTSAISLEYLTVGNNSINASFGGADTLQTSTSLPIAVNVEKAATTVALNGPTESTIGNPLRFTAQVSVLSPGSGTPTGTVRLYEGSELLQTKPVGANGTAAFDEFNSTGPAGEKQYRVLYSGDANYGGSEKAEAHTVKNADPGTPKVSIAKTGAGTGTFTLQVKLDNFTEKKIYGMQLHFLSDQDVAYQSPSAEANGTYYEDTIFQQPDYTAEMIKKQDGTVDGAAKRETIYALSLFGSGNAVTVDGDVAAVSIPFTYTGSGDISLVYVQFVDENGDTIAVADYN